MSKQSVKTTIDANIKQNGNQEITGQILNSVLNEMVDGLGGQDQVDSIERTLGKTIDVVNYGSTSNAFIVGTSGFQSYVAGDIVSFATSVLSSTIKVKKGGKLRVKINANNPTSGATAALYDSMTMSHTSLLSLLIPSYSAGSYEVEIPNDGYMVVGWRTTDTSPVVEYYEPYDMSYYDDIIKALPSDLSDVNKLASQNFASAQKDSSFTTIGDGFMVGASGFQDKEQGDIAALAGFKISDAKFARKGDVLHVKLTQNLGTATMIAALYNSPILSSSTFVADLIGTYVAGEYWIKIPNDGFVCVGKRSADTDATLELINYTYVQDVYKTLYEDDSWVKRLVESDVVTPSLHVSVDDCISCFHSLATQTPASIFDNPFFAQMKELHDLYGVKITLNCMVIYESIFGTWRLSQMPNTWASEFQANKDWLRFAFHGANDMTFDTTDALPYYNEFVSAIYRMTGDYDCIDRIIRTQSFTGSLYNVKRLMAADHGVVAFIGGMEKDDVVRKSYYLSDEKSAYLIRHGVYVDATNNVLFVKSFPYMDITSVSETQDQFNKYPCGRKYVELFFHLVPTAEKVFESLFNNVIKPTIAWFINTKGYENNFLYDLLK